MILQSGNVSIYHVVRSETNFIDTQSGLETVMGLLSATGGAIAVLTSLQYAKDSNNILTRSAFFRIISSCN